MWNKIKAFFGQQCVLTLGEMAWLAALIGGCFGALHAYVKNVEEATEANNATGWKNTKDIEELEFRVAELEYAERDR